MRGKLALTLCSLLICACLSPTPSGAGEWKEVFRRDHAVYLVELPPISHDCSSTQVRVRIKIEGTGFEEELIYQFSEDGKLYRNLDSVVRASDGGLVET